MLQGKIHGVKSKLPILKYRRTRGDMIEVYKLSTADK